MIERIFLWQLNRSGDIKKGISPLKVSAIFGVTDTQRKVGGILARHNIHPQRFRIVGKTLDIDFSFTLRSIRDREDAEAILMEL